MNNEVNCMKCGEVIREGDYFALKDYNNGGKEIPIEICMECIVDGVIEMEGRRDGKERMSDM